VTPRRPTLHPTSLALGIAAVFAATACGSNRRGPPDAPAVVLESAREQRGQRLFFGYCNPCHPGGEAGLGPSLNNKPLPDAAIRLVVRNGFGAMPSFSHDALADRQLDAIVAYLDELRDAPSEQVASARVSDSPQTAEVVGRDAD
jgi:mono/diheme cytochrome c family protein